MKKLYHRIFVLVLAMMIFAADGFSQKNILFIGRDALGTYQIDQDVNDSLIAWGYVPEFWDSNTDYTTGVGLDYANYDGMVINETVDSKAMARFGTTDGYPLPCVNMEGYAVANTSDRWGWLTDLPTQLLQTQSGEGTADDQVLVIKDNSHYITQGFEIGDEIIWSAATEASDISEIGVVAIQEVEVNYSAKLGQMKSQQGSSDFWNLLAIDDIDRSGNRMVFWGINANGLNGAEVNGGLGSYGTPEFFGLLRRTVEWILGEDGGTGIAPAKMNRFELHAYPNPASGRVTIRFKSAAYGESVATLYNMAGQTVGIFSKTVVEGNNSIFLDANNYPAGIYHLHLAIGGESALTKVVIQ